MIPHYFILSIFILVGILLILAALFNWEWLYTARNAQFITLRFGRKWARLIYALIGIILITQGSIFLHIVLTTT